MGKIFSGGFTKSKVASDSIAIAGKGNIKWTLPKVGFKSGTKSAYDATC